MMKYINPYNDLILEDLLIEAFKLNIKDFFKRKEKLIPIDYALLPTFDITKIEKDALSKGKKIQVETKPTKKIKKTISATDFLKYEKLLKKKLAEKLKTKSDADNYFTKILNNSKFDKTAKFIVGVIMLSVMTTKIVNYKISEKIAKDKYAKELVAKLNAIEDAKVYSDNLYNPIDIKEIQVLDVSAGVKILMDSIAMRESGNNPAEVNTMGYIGKYQFGDDALEEAGFKYISRAEFMKDPTIWPEEDQDLAMLNLLKRNKHIMRAHIEKYDGVIVNGKKVTESGILAGAHLKGAVAVRDYLDTDGEEDAKDGYGTYVSEYINKFSGHNIRGLDALKMRPKQIKKVK